MAKALKRKRRRRKWPERGAELVATVDKIAKERGKGTADAIRTAKSRDPKKWNRPVASLQTRYYEHKQRTATKRRVAEIDARIERKGSLKLSAAAKRVNAKSDREHRRLFGKRKRFIEPWHARITWSDLGCPTVPGTYKYRDLPVYVSAAKIAASKNNRDAVCTIYCTTFISDDGSKRCAVRIEQPESRLRRNRKRTTEIQFP